MGTPMEFPIDDEDYRSYVNPLGVNLTINGPHESDFDSLLEQLKYLNSLKNSEKDWQSEGQNEGQEPIANYNLSDGGAKLLVFSFLFFILICLRGWVKREIGSTGSKRISRPVLATSINRQAPTAEPEIREPGQDENERMANDQNQTHVIDIVTADLSSVSELNIYQVDIDPENGSDTCSILGHKDDLPPAYDNFLPPSYDYAIYYGCHDDTKNLKAKWV